MRPIAVSIKEALQLALPLQVLVQFVEHSYGRLGAQPVKAQGFRQRSRSPQELSAIVDIVPVEIGVAACQFCDGPQGQGIGKYPRLGGQGRPVFEKKADHLERGI